MSACFVAWLFRVRWRQHLQLATGCWLPRVRAAGEGVQESTAGGQVCPDFKLSSSPADPSFLPSLSTAWPDVLQCNAAAQCCVSAVLKQACCKSLLIGAAVSISQHQEVPGAATRTIMFWDCVQFKPHNPQQQFIANNATIYSISNVGPLQHD